MDSIPAYELQAAESLASLTTQKPLGMVLSIQQGHNLDKTTLRANDRTARMMTAIHTTSSKDANELCLLLKGFPPGADAASFARLEFELFYESGKPVKMQLENKHADHVDILEPSGASQTRRKISQAVFALDSRAKHTNKLQVPRLFFSGAFVDAVVGHDEEDCVHAELKFSTNITSKQHDKQRFYWRATLTAAIGRRRSFAVSETSLFEYVARRVNHKAPHKKTAPEPQKRWCAATDSMQWRWVDDRFGPCVEIATPSPKAAASPTPEGSALAQKFESCERRPMLEATNACREIVAVACSKRASPAEANAKVPEAATSTRLPVGHSSRQHGLASGFNDVLHATVMGAPKLDSFLEAAQLPPDRSSECPKAEDGHGASSSNDQDWDEKSDAHHIADCALWQSRNIVANVKHEDEEADGHHLVHGALRQLSSVAANSKHEDAQAVHNRITSGADLNAEPPQKRLRVISASNGAISLPQARSLKVYLPLGDAPAGYRR